MKNWWNIAYWRLLLFFNLCFQITEKDDLHLEDMDDDESIVTCFKKCRQKVIAEQLSAGLTEEQLEEEKE